MCLGKPDADCPIGTSGWPVPQSKTLRKSLFGQIRPEKEFRCVGALQEIALNAHEPRATDSVRNVNEHETDCAGSVRHGQVVPHLGLAQKS